MSNSVPSTIVLQGIRFMGGLYMSGFEWKGRFAYQGRLTCQGSGGRVSAGRIYTVNIHYIGDESKRLINLREHGLDFQEAHSVFEGRTITFEDGRDSRDLVPASHSARGNTFL